jgi:hypothetical protein
MGFSEVRVAQISSYINFFQEEATTRTMQILAYAEIYIVRVSYKNKKRFCGNAKTFFVYILKSVNP